VRGTVVDVTFHGGRSTCALAVEGRERPLLVTVAGSLPHAPGTELDATWAAADAVVLER
jgi:hypothetical protein